MRRVAASIDDISLVALFSTYVFHYHALISLHAELKHVTDMPHQAYFG